MRTCIVRILVHDYPGHPFQVQLSRSLAGRGHDVVHVYSGSVQSPRGALLRRESDPASFSITELRLPKPVRQHSFVRRRMQEIAYGRLLAETVEAVGPEVVLCSNTPLEAQAILMKQCRRRGVRFVFWVQDLRGIAAQRILRERIPVLGRPVGWYFVRLERSLLGKSDRIVAITEDFCPLLSRWGVPRDAVHVIHNWAPLEEIPPQPKDNPWSERHGLSGKLCILYSGTLGMKHNPELLLRLAARFEDDEAVRVVVVSEGAGADWLQEQKQKLGLGGLLLLPYQPFEVLAQVLGSADVLVAILEPEAGTFSVPSKVLTYLCAGRPLLLSVPPENLAARIVMESEAGLVVAPMDGDALVRAAESLVSEPRLRDRLGRNGRAYAEANFDIEAITDKFEEVLRM